MVLECIICKKPYKRFGKQIKTAKTCSKKCLGIYLKGKLNTKCTECGDMFHLKASSKKRYKRTQGYFCSATCVAEYRKKAYLGKTNPNFRVDVTRDWDGYTLDYIPKFGRIKLHHKIVFEYLNIEKLPKGYCVHHRDCNINNNDRVNLVLLNGSDHRWLHKQFGNATLWAYIHNKVAIKDLIAWSNDKKRAARLLPVSIVTQKESGVIKLGEFREKPEVVNPELSL